MNEIEVLQLGKQLEAEAAKSSFASFVKSMSPLDHRFEWFHKRIMAKLQGVYEGKIKRLMLFVPPQHGKSQLASRMFPAWALGKNPSIKIIGASYSADLAQSFSRDIQRIIDTSVYNYFFPDTYLSSSNVRADSTKSFLRNADIFEIVKKGGSYKSVGVCGSLTGSPCDIGIIDDPVKDAIEAYSSTYRERIWDWYMNVFTTRLHNDSRIILIMTRWHEDDLSGRILKAMRDGGDQWEVLIFPAIKEGDTSEEDPRMDGEALWPFRHSQEKILNVKKLSLKVYNSLYQQRPAPEEGHVFKKQWFRIYSMQSLIELEEGSVEKIAWKFVADTAYGEKEQNDPSSFMAYCYYKNNLYIRDVARVYMEMPELIRFSSDFVKRNGYSDRSTFKIEPKASGKSLVQMLKNNTNLNVSESFVPTTDKIARANLCVPFVESGRVYLLEGAGWFDMFMNEVKSFPASAHDDIVDCLTMSILGSESSEGGILGFRSF